ncbi:MAG: methylated-DNA--[protein]-cysteine S-methyltransferase [Kiloniellales bacterium]|nr:methylated-DNA--[protein]-cysteine S-methyltransferase [Kiloniellales bacterium]
MPSASFETPLGRLRLVEAEGRITRLKWRDGADSKEAPPSPLLAEAGRQLAAYLDGGLEAFDLPLAPAGSAFQSSVWREMIRIPYGEVLTYGEMAARTGGSARAVGGACGANPIPLIIPCHRVVAGEGLGGYSGGGGLATKRRLLVLEGALAPELPF